LDESMRQIMRYDSKSDPQMAASLFVYMHLIQCELVPKILTMTPSIGWIKLFFASCDKIEGEQNNYDREEENFVSEVVESISQHGTQEYEEFISTYLTSKARVGKLSRFFIPPYYSAIADKVPGTSYSAEKKHIEQESVNNADITPLLTKFFEVLGSTKTVIARPSLAFHNVDELPNTSIKKVAEFLGGRGKKVDFDILAEVFEFDINDKPAEAAKERKDVLGALRTTKQHTNELVLVLQQVRGHTRLGYDDIGWFSDGGFDDESAVQAQRIYEAHKDSKDAALKEEVARLKYAILPTGCKLLGFVLGWLRMVKLCWV